MSTSLMKEQKTSHISRAENKLKQLWHVINIKVKKAKLWEIQSGFPAITADENDFLYCLVISEMRRSMRHESLPGIIINSPHTVVLMDNIKQMAFFKQFENK